MLLGIVCRSNSRAACVGVGVRECGGVSLCVNSDATTCT